MSVGEQTERSAKMIAGFGIRVVADAIDIAILWAFALILDFVLEDRFLKLGKNGVWFGLFISIAYFVPMPSQYGNGQSLSKRLFIAFAGYIGVFTGITNLAAGTTLAAFVNSIYGTLWFIVFVGYYLLFTLHSLKHDLHDLIAGSVVVYRNQFNADALAALANPAKIKKAYAI